MSTNAHARERLDFIDAQRGLAVVLMIWMHTADAWLEPSLKLGRGWDVVRSLGGLAAPTFLLLVGVSLGLGWARARSGSGWPPSRRALTRGLQLIVLGYALRLQMWIVDAAGYRSPGGLIGALLLVAGYLSAYRALGAWGDGKRFGRDAGIAVLGVVLAFSGLLAEQPPPWTLLRVDVLQAIGASIVLLVLLRPLVQRWPALGVGLGALVALATPWFKSWVPGPLPASVAAYLAQWPPAANERVAALFPLFPWLAYAFVGASIGAALARAAERGASGRGVLSLTGVGLALAVLACEPLPLAGGLLRSAPALADLNRVAYRVGVALLLGGLAWLLSRTLLRGPLLILGRTSLFVYWVHLELAFGIVATPLADTLGFGGWLVGFAGLTVAMTLLAALWERVRGPGVRPAQAAAGPPTPGFSGA